jgi:lipopolysaccharide export system protein LptA
MMKNIVLVLSLIAGVFSPLAAQFFDSRKNEPANLTAGKSTYQWAIKKMILQTTNNIRPYIVKGGSTLQADTIIYDSEKDIGYAYSNVEFDNPKKGMVLTAGQGTYFSQKQEVYVKEHPFVKMAKEKTTARSDTMTIYNDRDYIVLIGHVVIRNVSNLITGQKATYYSKTGRFIVVSNARAIQNDLTVKGDLIDMTVLDGDIQNYVADGNVYLENKKDGYNLTAGKMDYDKKIGFTRLSDHPSVNMSEAGTTNQNTHMTADRIDLNTDTNGKMKSYTAIGNVHVRDLKEGYVIDSGRLDYYNAKGYAKITQKPVIHFEGRKMDAYALTMERYDREKKANLLGDVRIVQEGKIAYSRWAEYRTAERKMTMTGNPIIVEGESRWKTQKVVVDVDTGVMDMIGNGQGVFQYQMQ